ncbi:LysR family transcriptional regulator [Sphingomonas sp.]|uniref:LysR family transcriptional regulator n=1 Tax=Sphingomonas sp. TaxID=28214 RepID=UPI000DAF6DC9|nr:LysR family transcriptional regulator [Sphingomonas sp.]PZU07600.1 MAG: LysR family transcriptional regulator [Sphingomonas sp.]
MLDRYLLRYFLAVVDHGNFSRAAAACNVSQPTLSVGIAKLERTLGLSLFVRSNQRVELTEPGARFLVHARRIEREFNAALQAMGTTTRLSTFRLGVLGSIPGSLIAQGIAGTKPGDDHRFELVFGTERELVGHLSRGRIDVALTLVGRGSPRFLERPVMSEGYALALPQDHSLAGEEDIAAERLAHEVMIVRRHCEALSDTSRHFTERGVRPHFAMRSTNDERVLQMVAAGMGITVMPLCYRHEGVVRPRLSGFTLRRVLGWAAAHDAEHFLDEPPPLIRLIDSLLSGLGTRAN